jgi:hypothetical protein
MSHKTKAQNAKDNRAHRQRQREEKKSLVARIARLEDRLSEAMTNISLLEEQRRSSIAFTTELMGMLDATAAQRKSDEVLLAEVAKWKERYDDLVQRVEDSSLSREEQIFVLSKIHPDKNGNSEVSNKATEKLLRRVWQ